MHHLIYRKIKDYEEMSNSTEKVIKISQCLEFIIMYYASIFYCHTKADNLVSKEIIEVILTNFYKKNPLLSSWVKLLRGSIELCEIDQSGFGNIVSSGSYMYRITSDDVTKVKKLTLLR